MHALMQVYFHMTMHVLRKWVPACCMHAHLQHVCKKQGTLTHFQQHI